MNFGDIRSVSMDTGQTDFKFIDKHNCICVGNSVACVEMRIKKHNEFVINMTAVLNCHYYLLSIPWNSIAKLLGKQI